MTVFLGLMIPFLGTTLGAACVFFLEKELGANVQKALLGFASGLVGIALLVRNLKFRRHTPEELWVNRYAPPDPEDGSGQ